MICHWGPSKNTQFQPDKNIKTASYRKHTSVYQYYILKNKNILCEKRKNKRYTYIYQTPICTQKAKLIFYAWTVKDNI